MDRLLEYEGLVGSVIKRYTNYFDQDDLYQVGMIGLINAYKNFDSNHNIKFSTYAYYYILGEVKKFVRNSGLVKISSDLIKLRTSIEKAKDFMRQKIGREPTLDEVGLYLEIDVDKVQEANLAFQDVKSLDCVYEEDGDEFYNCVQCVDQAMGADVLDLKTELEKLSDEERELIKSRYYDDLTQRETSDRLGISQVQVSRKEGKILEKLRDRL